MAPEPAGQPFGTGALPVGGASRPTPAAPSLPRIEDLPQRQRIVLALAIAAAVGLLAASGYRIVTGVDLWQWWVPIVCLGGIAAADLGSGLVHWGADTWGHDDLPVIGQRLLVPFRVHHINPNDLLRRRFADTNGDVAVIALPVLLGLLVVPLDSRWGAGTAVFGFAFCGVGMFTNQIHQWAHMASPPRSVRLLQHCGVLLGRVAHRAHHDRPYNAQYCITTGWCNRPLEAIGLFRGLESLITRITGAQPRREDDLYEARYGKDELRRNG